MTTALSLVLPVSTVRVSGPAGLNLTAAAGTITVAAYQDLHLAAGQGRVGGKVLWLTLV